jgi:hypothetical protein
MLFVLILCLYYLSVCQSRKCCMGLHIYIYNMRQVSHEAIRPLYPTRNPRTRIARTLSPHNTQRRDRHCKIPWHNRRSAGRHALRIRNTALRMPNLYQALIAMSALGCSVRITGVKHVRFGHFSLPNIGGFGDISIGCFLSKMRELVCN